MRRHLRGRNVILGGILLVMVLVVGLSPWSVVSPSLVPSCNLSISTDVALAAGPSAVYEDVVVYPSSADTDYEKLLCVYNLIEQARLYHNSQGNAASLSWKQYEDQWQDFARIYKRKIKLLLDEQNRLRERIRLANYTEEEWAKLPTEPWIKGNIYEVMEELWGNKEELKSLPTLATSPPLEDFKAITLDDVQGVPIVDPTEDYTTYTELDPDSDITVTSSKIDVSSMARSLDAWVYDDKGANHFDGDFEHLVEMYHEDGQWVTVAVWAIANSVESINDWQGNDHDALACVWTTWDWTPWISLREIGTSDYADNWTGPDSETIYYVTIERDEAVGTYGTLYAYIYSDASRTTLEDTLSLTLHGSKMDYQYIFGLNNRGSEGGNNWTGYAQDLDLQEAACSEDISNTPSSHDYGVVSTSSTNSTNINKFTMTNNSGGAVTITIKAIDFTGGNGWTLSDTATAGSDIAGLKAGCDDDDDTFDVIVKKSSPYNTLVSGLADSGTQDWGLQLLAPTEFSDGVQKTTTVTLTATCD